MGLIVTLVIWIFEGMLAAELEGFYFHHKKFYFPTSLHFNWLGLLGLSNYQTRGSVALAAVVPKRCSESY